MTENNEVRLLNVHSLKSNFKEHEGKLEMSVSFSCETPEDIYILLRMQKRKLPLNVTILSLQKDLPLKDVQK